MSEPADQDQRTRFITEHDRNFSVVASAGSGKTRAITDRIVALARGPHARDWLPALLVVTYTNRAASEMQQRARQSLLEAGLSLDVLAAFGRTFFGTIHSLCLRLLTQHGHRLGLPGRLDHLEDDEALWQKFVQRYTSVSAHLSESQRTALLRLVPVRELMELGRHAAFDVPPESPGDFPSFDFSAIYSFVPSQERSVPPAERSKAALRRWEKQWAGNGFAPLPESDGKPIREVWDAAVAPLRAWRQRAALCVAAEVSRAYREFRLAEGQITFDDQSALAGSLLRDADAARTIRAKNYRVILDEAQDTDPGQFDILLALTRPNDEAPPRAGHFSMVGDFQQSIYGGRADLAHYRHVHDELIASGAGEALEFSVTFRLDRQPLDFVNTTFPTVLSGLDRQVSFVELAARAGAHSGQVIRCDLGEWPEFFHKQDGPRVWEEADRLAAWLRAQGLNGLRADRWSDVAILCPRKSWFAPLHWALRKQDFAVQIQSERDIRGDHPAFAWFTALVVIMAQPRNSYEIVGVLREVFGLSDHDLAVFSESRGHRFQIAKPTTLFGPVAETLNFLAKLRRKIVALPLFLAMRELIAATHLRSRLLALPFERLDEELEILLTRTATAEAADTTLTVFADELRADFGKIRDVRAADPKAIQLITAHKAKGSEWQAVIVPYFARNVVSFNPGYPQLLRNPVDRQPSAALDKGDIDEELEAELKLAERQEMERLLYVTMTRAKHTLVIVDDRALFAGKNGIPKNAPARWLQCGEKEANDLAFTALPAEPSSCPETEAAQRERTVRRAAEAEARMLPPVDAGVKAAAPGRSAAFQKRNPSAMAEAAIAEADPTTHAPVARRKTELRNSGQIYGTWWHEFVELLAWPAGATAWNATFKDAVKGSPDNGRSKREWQALRTELTESSELGKWLLDADRIAHAELPFLWAMNERECLDGIIDLAVFDPASGGWLILDWKTNKTTVEDLPKLRAHYLPQLSAYWQAAGQMLKAPISAGIYSTVTGRWLPYSEEELAGSWEKLARTPEKIEQVLGED